MAFPASRTGIVGGEKPRRAVAIIHPSQIGGAGEDIVADIEGIRTQTVLAPQFGVSPRHDLHQSHGAGPGDGAAIAGAFDAHDRTYPMLLHTKAARGFCYGVCHGIYAPRRRGGTILGGGFMGCGATARQDERGETKASGGDDPHRQSPSRVHTGWARPMMLEAGRGPK